MNTGKMSSGKRTAANPPPTVPPKLCFKRDECAELLRVSVATLDRMIVKKEIGFIRLHDRGVRIRQADVDAYLNGEKRKWEMPLPHPGPLPPAAAGRRGSSDAKGGSL